MLPIIKGTEAVDNEWVNTLNIKSIGIEPKHRKHRKARSLVEIAESIARESRLGAVRVEGANEDAKGLFEHLGYDTTFGDPFKRLVY